MGVAALIILTIVALGHTYYTYSSVHKYNLVNKPVHIAYYNNAIVGSKYFIISFLAFIVFWGLYKIFLKENFEISFINIFNVYKGYYDNTPSLTTVWLCSTIISFPLIFLSAKYENYKLKVKIKEKLNEIEKFKVNKKDQRKHNKIVISEYQIYEETLLDPLDRLISNSAYEKESQYLLFTMKDKKVYVGKVKADPDIFDRFSQGVFNFLIEPKYSGYRDKDTLEIILTTSYLNRVSNTYEIVLDRKEILSATKVSLPELVNYLKNKNQFSDLVYEAWATGMPLLIINKENIGFVVTISEDLNLNGNVSYKFEFLKVNIVYQILFNADKTIDNYLDFSQGKNFSILIRLEDIKHIYTVNKVEDIWLKDGNLDPKYWINLMNYRSVKKRELF